MIPNFANGHRAAGVQEVLQVPEVLAYLKSIGKIERFDPNDLAASVGETIKVTAVVCRPFAGYMDSKVEVRNYQLGKDTRIVDGNVAIRPGELPVQVPTSSKPPQSSTQ